MTTSSDRLWGARFSNGPANAMVKLSRSPRTYFRLTPYDIAGSMAHCSELLRAGLLSDEEHQAITLALKGIQTDFSNGELHPNENDEDIHTFVERVLIERLGSLGGKLRAGRSRNDQSANDSRLFLRDQVRRIGIMVLELQHAIIEQSKRHKYTISPGFTHLQQAQPVIFGHHLLAHSQAFLRDVQRLTDWDRRFSTSPLGAAALSGSAITNSMEKSAREMGYNAPCENSIDAVASRDHIAEFLFIVSMLGVNLSRLSEEICLWTSQQFRWVKLDDGYATGSSIMPQKKNPDIAELTRGKSGRLIGNLTGMLTTLKAQPLAYNRDLGEDKHQIIDAVETLELVLPAMAGMISTMVVDESELRRQAPLGFTLATEMADWLAKQGVPFNHAHEITGAAVRLCEQHGIELDGLTQEMLKEVDNHLSAEVLQCLTLEAAIEARSGYGGTAVERVEEQLQRLELALEEQHQWCKHYTGPRVL
ncbi:argininosuccinate lyase [Vreelandella olivaria]|uniref:argininosuccinate lyase n=1 Tax=Vreelandella olivaria TaxID=390919 RepID=UPI00201F988D|nr:argininosuccinate lyase [Halomonas olivaria]